MLHIPRGSDEGVLAASPYRPNLRLYSYEVKNGEEKRSALVKLLRNGNLNAEDSKNKMSHKSNARDSTIIYVWRRDEVDLLYEYLSALNVGQGKRSNVRMQRRDDEDQSGDLDWGQGKIVKYHAGLSSEQRERAQNQFIRYVLQIA